MWYVYAQENKNYIITAVVIVVGLSGGCTIAKF